MLGNCKYLVLVFDERLNKLAGKQQMDVVVRYWGDEVNRVHTIDTFLLYFYIV